MNKILLNIDSKYRDQNIYQNANYFKLKINDSIDLNNINYIKLNDINISINNCFICESKNNNFFRLKGEFVGPPPGPNVFNLPTNEIQINIPKNKYNIDLLINTINKELNKNKFNEYDIDNNIIKGIYLYLNDSKIIIKNLSKHYKCHILFNVIDNKSNYLSLGYYLGFINNTYILDINYYIVGELLPNIKDDYLFLKINNFNNIYINLYNTQNQINQDSFITAFCKINYNQEKNNYILDNKYEYIYISDDLINVSELEFSILDYNGNKVYIYDNYYFTLEFGLLNYYDNIIFPNNKDFDTKSYLNKNIIQKIELDSHILPMEVINQNNKNISSIEIQNQNTLINNENKNKCFHTTEIINQNSEINNNNNNNNESPKKKNKLKNKKKFGFNY